MPYACIIYFDIFIYFFIFIGPSTIYAFHIVYEIHYDNVIDTATDYATHLGAYEPDLASIMELSRAREAFEKVMEISRRVIASALEEVNIGTMSEPRLLSIAKELVPD